MIKINATAFKCSLFVTTTNGFVTFLQDTLEVYMIPGCGMSAVCQKSLAQYFSEDQWISGDKGYGFSKYMIVPFRENARRIPSKKLHAFNKYFSSHPVKIEHVNGALKQTFGSLKQLRVHVDDLQGHIQATNCLILYNIIMPLDNWQPVDCEVMSRDETNSVAQDDEFSAENKRMAIYYHVINKLNIN